MFDAASPRPPLRPRDLEDLRFFGVEGGLVPSDDAIAAATPAAIRAGWDEVVARGPAAPARRARRLGCARDPPAPDPAARARGAARRSPGGARRARRSRRSGRSGSTAGGELEERVLARQLELARELRLPVVVSTPWRGRERITRRVLAVLREAELDPARVLVDRRGRADRPPHPRVRAPRRRCRSRGEAGSTPRWTLPFARRGARPGGARARLGRGARGRRPARARARGGPAREGGTLRRGRAAGLRRERPRVPRGGRGRAPRAAAPALRR